MWPAQPYPATAKSVVCGTAQPLSDGLDPDKPRTSIILYLKAFQGVRGPRARLGDAPCVPYSKAVGQSGRDLTRECEVRQGKKPVFCARREDLGPSLFLTRGTPPGRGCCFASLLSDSPVANTQQKKSFYLQEPKSKYPVFF